MLLALKCMVQKPSRSVGLEHYCGSGSAKAYHDRDIDARNGPAWKLSDAVSLADPVSPLRTWNFGKRMEISVICRTKENRHSDKDKH
jgi:hypothetical protein